MENNKQVPVLKVNVKGVGLFIAELSEFLLFKGDLRAFLKDNGAEYEVHDDELLSAVEVKHYTRQEFDELPGWND